MDLTHVHLLLNHAPVAALGFGLFFLAMGTYKRAESMKLSAMTLFLLGSLLVIPVFFTGEPAEEVAENLPGVSESFIESHEDSAQASLIGMLLLGAASAGSLALYAKRRTISPKLFLAVTLLAIVSSVFIGRTAYLGGQIRHTEVRTGANGSDVGSPARSASDD
jgi:uncharacterized membrane protein